MAECQSLTEQTQSRGEHAVRAAVSEATALCRLRMSTHIARKILQFSKEKRNAYRFNTEDETENCSSKCPVVADILKNDQIEHRIEDILAHISILCQMFPETLTS